VPDSQIAPDATYLYRPLGAWQVAKPVNTSNFGFAPGATSTNQLYRIDYASLIIGFDVLDLSASADLEISTVPGGFIPLLSVSTGIGIGGGGAINLRPLAQLALPFYLFGNFGIFISGSAGRPLPSSTIWASVSVSSCWPPE
jgi:hypothetical protein